MPDSVLGIDIGTTAIKAIVLSIDDGGSARVLAAESIPHDLLSPHPGWAEESAVIWREHSLSILRLLSSSVDLSGLKAIALTGMVPALVLLDEDMAPIRPSIQQNDMRTKEELDELRLLLDDDEVFSKTGSAINSQHILPRLMWLRRHETSAFSRTRHICGSYDYIGYVLTGSLHVEENWALESGMYAIRERRWCSDMLEKAGFDESILPPVASCRDIIGYTTEAISSATGIPKGIPVYAGTADHVASAYATGAVEEGSLVLKLGGAGDILLASASPVTDRRLYIDYHPSLSAPYIINGCTAASGSLLKWFSLQFGGSFSELDRMAEDVPPASDGLVILPYVLGEKTPVFDPYARGVIYGLTLSHTKAHIYRAILESVAYAFRHHLDIFREDGLPVKRVFITNGGSTSPLWRQIMADVLGYDVVYIKKNPGSCLGAAFIAGTASGLFDESAIDAFVQEGIATKRDERTKQLYDAAYAKFRMLYPALKSVFRS